MVMKRNYLSEVQNSILAHKEQEQDLDLAVDESIDHTLLLVNDEHNTFDFVIITIMDILGYDELRAEQVTLLAHFNGKAKLKKGSKALLKEYSGKFGKEGITTVVD